MGIRDILVNSPLGFGTAPLGNIFRDIPDQDPVRQLARVLSAGPRLGDATDRAGTPSGRR